jgi:hypothetical protein
MAHNDFATILHSIKSLSRDQMRQLQCELETELMAKQPVGHGQGSLGAMRDADDELDEAVEHPMNLRQRSWRLPHGE